MWAFELKTVDPAEIDQGPLKHKNLTKAWLCFLALFIGSLIALVGAGAMVASNALLFVPIAFILSRMVAIDVCYLLLLNIYTFPLAFVGLFYSVYLVGHTWADSLLGLAVGAGVGLVIDVALHLVRRGEADLGFGDVKMLGALGAWVGLDHLPFALTVAFMANFLLALILPKNSAIPFGFGLAIAIWVFSALEPQVTGLLYQAMGI